MNGRAGPGEREREAIFAEAQRHHQADRLAEAEALYRRVLVADPRHFGALYCLGAVSARRGEHAAAEAWIGRALVLAPDHAEAHFNFGNAQREQGRLAEAAASFQRALALKPDYAEAHFGLGLVLQAQGRADVAAECYRQSLRLKPNDAVALRHLGIALQALNQPNEAMAAYRHALEVEPGVADIYNHLGVALGDQDKIEEASAALAKALALKPDYPEALYNLGLLLQRRGHFAEAMARYRRAVSLKPDYVQAHYNLGNVQARLGQLQEAETSYRRVLALKPNSAEAHLNLGVAHYAQRRPAEAVRSYRRALALKQDYAEAHYYIAMSQLLLGDFSGGAAEYEWRWQVEGAPRLSALDAPGWDGRPMPGETILLRAEQGFGDAIHFVRYAPLVRARCGRVVLECVAPLVRLLTTASGIDEVVAAGLPLPAFAVHAPLMSLMQLFGTRIETIPATVPYLFAEGARVAALRERMSTIAGLKVGLVWAGSSRHTNDRNRSVQLEALRPLLEIPGVSFFNLQKDARAEEIAATGLATRLIDLGPVLGDFADAAAAVSCLDLIITVDTAMAHLAGALAKPVWNLLPFAPDWRWLLDRADSPWYASMRLFRQPALGDWASVIQAVAATLRHVAHQDGDLFAEACRAHQAGRSGEAEVLYHYILAEDPEHIGARHYLGIAAAQRGDYDVAERLIRRVLALAPTYAEAHCNLGNTLQALGRLDEALACFQRTLELKPGYALAHYNLGNTLRTQGRLEMAESSYRQALALQPDYAEAHTNLGVVLKQQGRVVDAVASYRQALALAPGLALAHYNLSMSLLAQGDIEHGAAEYEWRWTAEGGPRLPPLEAPRWDGSVMVGQTILLRAEQGLGDAIQFVRYAAQARARCGRVVVECAGPLAGLLATAPGVDQVVAAGLPVPAIAASAPLMSLMYLFGTRLETIPSGVPYLAAEPATVAAFRERIGAAPGLKVGLAWAGNPDHWNDRNRSLELAALAPLFEVEGALFFSLQKGPRAAEIDAAGLTDRIIDLSPALGDFADTAAALSCLDLVISVDTAVAHLAGALGKPVWTLLAYAPDWRWLMDRADSPWYPTMRLYRQPAIGNWASVANAVAKSLSRFHDKSDLFTQANRHHMSGHLAEAEAVYRRILATDPSHAGALHNLGIANAQRGEHAAAEEMFSRALALAPGDAGLHNNLGNARRVQGRLDEAVASFGRALVLAPNHAEAHNNLGAALSAQGRLTEATASYERSLALKPKSPLAHYNLATALLAQGEFARGLAEYEWRGYAGIGTPLPPLAAPAWDGKSRSDGTILLRSEQGFGDAIQFVRYATQVRARCGRVVLQCDDPLVRLLSTVPGLDQVIAASDAVPLIAAHAPLPSLMHLFGTRLETIPAKVPYLAAEPATVAAFRERIGAAPGLKVGLAWAGNPDHWNDRNRSLELAKLAPLFEVEGALFVSLQKGPRAAEIAAAGLTDRIIDLSPALGDFADTAAALSCLDLVISVDTAVAHLAGALGKPVWTLLAYAPDWRWLMDRADSPWYPTMRLYRQSTLGDWRAAIEQAAKDLRRVAGSHHAETHADGLEGLAKHATPAQLASTGPDVVGLDALPQVGADELADRFNKRLAIIVPYRNRAQHLTAFIPHMLTYFQRAESECALPISIHVVEQHGNAPFNRGKINNAGYMLVRELADYVCFHDVDYLPISADYSWSRRPARLAWHGLRLREDWDNFFGAVVLFDKPAFEQVNGFPNGYWGWGPEDEELGMRCKLTGLGFDRRDGTYRGLPHRHAGFSAPGVLTEEARRTRALYAVRRRNLLAVMADDGLSSLQFEPLRCTPLRLDAMDPVNCFHHLVDIGGPDAVD